MRVRVPPASEDGGKKIADDLEVKDWLDLKDSVTESRLQPR
jgi:hypothetical protein